MADSATEIAAARALVLETARKRDAGEDVTMDVSMCKLYASETCGRVADRAVQIGTDLVADLSAKLLREKIVEAGRVSFPAVLRHNYNLLFQSIRVEKPAPPQMDAPAPAVEPKPVPPTKPAEPPPPAAPVTEPANCALEIRPYHTPRH